MDGLEDVEMNGYRVHKDTGLLSCEAEKVLDVTHRTSGHHLFFGNLYLIVLKSLSEK